MFKNPFSFNGRIRRIEYLLSNLLSGFVSGIAFWLGIGASLVSAEAESVGGFGFGMLMSIAAIVGGIWFTIAQDVKRLHDVDKSGWFVILLLIPIVNFMLGLYMLLADGTVGPNRYGEDPKNRMPYFQPTQVNVIVKTNGDITKSEIIESETK